MKRRNASNLVGGVVCALAASGSAHAQLYKQNFEVNSTATWTLNGGPSDEAANFFFDYSTIGIPPAPSLPGTRGMKLQANLSSGVFGGMSVSPIGQSFTGDYILRFDWWANVNGPFPIGGSGSTNLSTFGIGTAGVAAQWPGAGPALDSVMFAANGDGNSAADWRAYSPAEPLAYPDGSPIYTAVGAGNRNHTHPHYSIFGNATAPATQLLLFPQQSGAPLVGSAGMEWHHVRIRKSGSIVTWTVDGHSIATINSNTFVFGGTNIHFGHSDTNATSSTDPNDAALLFTLIDNIRVTRPADINGDGAVNVIDLLAVINSWGACAPVPDLTGCPADIAPTPAGDDVVNVVDLLFVINNWG